MGKHVYNKLQGKRIIILVLLAIILFPNLCLAEEDTPRLTIVYFYENVCGSCNPEAEFIDFFNEQVGEYKEGVNVELLMYNTFHDSGYQLMKKYCKDFGVPENEQIAPILFIGDTYLMGSSKIQEKFKDEFIKAKENLKTSPSQASTIIYFHVTGCSSCEEVDKFLSTVQGIIVNKYNIAEPDNLELVKKYFKAYNVPEKDQSVPIVFIGDIYLSGEEAIIGRLIEEVEQGKGLETPVLIQDDATENELSGYGILGVMTTGFINGLNPCSISMLLFFLSMILVRNVNVLKVGFSFILGKFIAYVLLGTLLFNLFVKLDIPWFHTAVKSVLLALVIIIALLNIRDFFAARKEEYDNIKMQLPAFLRKKNHQWIKRFTSIENEKILMPVCFGLGALISAGEFLCTGQIYLATIVAVLHNSPVFDFKAAIYFIIYGLAFVAPPVILTILIYKGREIFDVSEWVRERMPIIKLINAIVFIIFAVAVLVWFD